MKRMKKRDFENALRSMQEELNALHNWLRHKGRRLLALFEGRDAAGKGGTINAIAERLNPRDCHIVALSKPGEREQSQWYFQRYVPHLPAAGEITLFDRSWYNRAGVEKVMGFCSDAQYRAFLKQAPQFERMLADDGIMILKYWLAVDQIEQERRFAERVRDPVKRWKLSPVDVAARERYQDYSDAREAMFKATHKRHAPWFVVDFNDQRRGRLNLIRHLIDQVPNRAVPEPVLELPPLAVGKLRRERYSGVVTPIEGPY
ncbi:MAG TPA: polyphosphate kinase 2 [Xanthomonadaceae bacterium]|nr:polyphosphate kinase 2 [Xanthomonadaceae bacterium]